MYIIYITVLACCKKREGCYLVGLGLLTLIVFAINDIIFLSVILADSNNHFLRKIVTRGDLSSWGLLIFVFTQSIVLARKFSRSFSQVESLTERLQEININLEGEVRARTRALETSKEELKEAYHTVSRSQKSLQDLLQNISHDLRTPLTAVKGYIDLIIDGIVKEPLQKEKYLSRAKDQVNHINQMVQELFELSQLQSRQIKLNFTPITIKNFIGVNSEKYSLDLLNKQDRINFKVNYPSGWLDHTQELSNFLVSVDPEKIDRVLTNLLSNALKYTNDGDGIELSFLLFKDRKQLLVKVSDTGIGISPQDLPYVFDRFYMVSTAQKTTKSSSGLGLTIVKEIIECHNGQIWVESELGQGSQFCFTLPFYNTNEFDPAPTKS